MKNDKLMADLVGRYGRKRGEAVYAAMVGEAKGPFAPGAKYHDEHLAWARTAGVAPITGDTKKPPASTRRGASRKG